MVEKINKDKFEEVTKKGNVVVDFSATWCGPCRMLAPVMEDVSNELTDTKFYNVDIDENENLANALGIQAVPTVLLFRDGRLANTSVGFMPKEEIIDFIKRSK